MGFNSLLHCIACVIKSFYVICVFSCRKNKARRTHTDLPEEMDVTISTSGKLKMK